VSRRQSVTSHPTLKYGYQTSLCIAGRMTRCTCQEFQQCST
jgi:hypothetical protein